jgi:arsenite methyltransferase
VPAGPAIAPGSVDRAELERHVAEMYRDVAHERFEQLHFLTGRTLAETLGYPSEILDRLPAAAVASFAGVGHHLDLARLQPGERVLDLGSGSGVDAFAAAVQVGPDGAVDGVDITPEQLAKADRLRRDAHVRFHPARIEALPFADASFDAVISNGVLNLSPDKRQAFAEAARVLRPGGRLALSDIVTERQIVARTTRQADLWAACIAGAAQRDGYLADLAAAGLRLEVLRENPAYRFASERAARAAARYGARSVSLLAGKPVPTSPHTSTTTQALEQ